MGPKDPICKNMLNKRVRGWVALYNAIESCVIISLAGPHAARVLQSSRSSRGRRHCLNLCEVAQNTIGPPEEVRSEESIYNNHPIFPEPRFPASSCPNMNQDHGNIFRQGSKPTCLQTQKIIVGDTNKLSPTAPAP